MSQKMIGEVIVSVQKIGDIWKVIPPEVTLKQTEKFKVQIIGQQNAKVWIPTQAIFGEEFFELSASNDWQMSAEVLQSAPEGDQDYTVYVYEEKKLADGKSPPKMIIEKGP